MKRRKVRTSKEATTADMQNTSIADQPERTYINIKKIMRYFIKKGREIKKERKKERKKSKRKKSKRRKVIPDFF
jgi:hypothetical protein